MQCRASRLWCAMGLIDVPVVSSIYKMHWKRKREGGMSVVQEKGGWIKGRTKWIGQEHIMVRKK